MAAKRIKSSAKVKGTVGQSEAAVTASAGGRPAISREALLFATRRLIEHLPTETLRAGLPALAEHTTQERQRPTRESVVDWADVPLGDFFAPVDMVDWPRIAGALESGKAACVRGGLADGWDEYQWRVFGYGRLGCVNVHIEFKGFDVWFLPRAQMEGILIHDPLGEEH